MAAALKRARIELLNGYLVRVQPDVRGKGGKVRNRHQAGVLPGPGMARINRATCSGSSSWTKCRAPGIRNSSEPGRNSWNDRATPLFREGSASPKMIRTGRLNSFSLGIICVRERTVGNKSSFRRKKAGRALGVA